MIKQVGDFEYEIGDNTVFVDENPRCNCKEFHKNGTCEHLKQVQEYLETPPPSQDDENVIDGEFEELADGNGKEETTALARRGALDIDTIIRNAEAVMLLSRKIREICYLELNQARYWTKFGTKYRPTKEAAERIISGASLSYRYLNGKMINKSDNSITYEVDCEMWFSDIPDNRIQAPGAVSSHKPWYSRKPDPDDKNPDRKKRKKIDIPQDIVSTHRDDDIIKHAKTQAKINALVARLGLDVTPEKLKKVGINLKDIKERSSGKQNN